MCVHVRLPLARACCDLLCRAALCCAAHPHTSLDMQQGRMVCQTCGLVVGDRIIAEGAEWRTFADCKFQTNPHPVRCLRLQRM
jgi:hypothetical protein